MTVYEEVELKVLRVLADKVTKMFGYTGWDDCDADAAKAVHEVEKTLKWVHAFQEAGAELGKEGGQ